MKKIISRLFFTLLFLSSYAVANPVETDNVKASLVSQVSVAQPGQSFFVALVFDIREDWHTYWRNPGDSGLAPSIDWQLPDGVTVHDFEWPYPERQYMGPVANYGYHGQALHRIKVDVSPNWPIGKPISLQANTRWLVCLEECIPEQGVLTLNIETASDVKEAQSNKALFGRFSTLLPQKLEIQSAYQYTDDQRIRFEFAPDERLTSAVTVEYFPFEWGVTQAPAKQQVVIDSRFVSIITEKGDLSFSNELKGLLVVHGANNRVRSYEVTSAHGVLNIEGEGFKQSPHDEQNQMTVLLALIFAFLGGIVLNLMPCVFPVLSMKALSLVSHSNESPNVIRTHGLFYTLGILVCFLLLGIALAVLKSAGHEVGWGFQLQRPIFVSLVVLVLFVLGLSLSGYLEIGASLMGVGSGLANKSGYTGSFFTGVLAVVVATPCTAPLMGPAIGFALTQSTPVMLFVLMALGFGLALPYLVLSLFPVLALYLPKPGAWMTVFRQFLAFPIFASAVWLVWVLGQQAGVNSIFCLLMILLVSTLVIWLWQQMRSSLGRWKMFSAVGLIISVIGLIALLCLQYFLVNLSDIPSADTRGISKDERISADFKPFSKNALNALQKEGRPVFVNMTAAWCITCLANEKVALSTAKLKTFFDENDITYLKGDWTNQDPEITQYLKTFGRSSVPLYVFYPAGHAKSEPLVLPQILTPDSVIDAINATSMATPINESSGH